jgi:hypothetical protein
VTPPQKMCYCVCPCPCGYYGDPQKPCTCSNSTVTKYQKRISGPLLDRIDIHIQVPRVDYDKLSDRRMGESSKAVRARVEAARDHHRRISMDTTSSLVPQSLRWYEVWKEVLFHPSEKTFHRILSDPAASLSRAYLWVAVTGTLFGIYFCIYMTTHCPVCTVRDFVITLIAFPISGMFLLALSAITLHWFAKLIGGQGIYNHIVYGLGAILAPTFLVLLLLMLLPLPGTLTFLIQIILNIYIIFLSALVIKVVERLDTRKTLFVLIPLLIIYGLPYTLIIRR